MISAEPTELLAGVRFWGDAWDIEETGALIHRLCEHEALAGEIGGFVLGLAYEVGKAGDGARQVRTIKHRDDRKTIYGFPVIWVYAIAQIAILRGVAAAIPLGLREQAMLSALEAALGGAVEAGFPDDAPAILATMARLRPGPWAPIVAAADGRADYFIQLAGLEDRRNGLLPVLRSLMPSDVPDPRTIRRSAFVRRGGEAFPEFAW